MTRFYIEIRPKLFLISMMNIVLSHLDKNYQTISDRFPKVKSIMRIEEIKIGSYVILDPNFLSHEKIIDLIQNQKSQIFYFLSKDQSFLINSPNKESQGNIIKLT